MNQNLKYIFSIGMIDLSYSIIHAFLIHILNKLQWALIKSKVTRVCNRKAELCLMWFQLCWVEI